MSDIINRGVLDASIIDEKKTLVDWWLFARDRAVECASILYIFDVTKQLANRLLEPFMYHKVLVSGTEWENFMALRTPIYEIGLTPDDSEVAVGKSWKELMSWRGTGGIWAGDMDTDNIVERLQYNKGQADIHMMFLAEAIYDAMNESTPTKLKEGEWHIPYGDNMDEDILLDKSVYGYESSTQESQGGWTIEGGEDAYYYNLDVLKCKISIARCARLSYQTLGDNPVINYEKDLALYQTLHDSGHASPAEHVGRAMTNEEYNSFYRQEGEQKLLGYSRNFRGFRQWREIVNL